MDNARDMTRMGKTENSVMSWLRLIRLPNLFTLPGDILVGYFILLPKASDRSASVFCMLLAVSLSLYTSGILLNDWFDRDRDSAERPDRPLVSGKINSSTALTAAICLIVSALIIAAFVGMTTFSIAVLLAILVVFYNSLARRIPAIGFLTMGLCRGVNIILGASVMIPHLPLLIQYAVFIETCYIIAVTIAAYHEAERAPRGITRWLPAIVLLVGFSLLAGITTIDWKGLFAILISTGYVLYVSNSMKKELPVRGVQSKIAAFIHSLIPIQGAFLLLSKQDSTLLVIILYLLWPLGRITGRMVNGS